MITKNDEIGLAAIDEGRRAQEMREWCRVTSRAAARIRMRVPTTTVVRWKPGDTLWVWADVIDKDGQLQSKVYGYIPAFCFEIIGRINERGE